MRPGRNAPIIMLTSADIRSEEQGFAAIRIDAHLMKPARSSLLLETIVETLQKAHGGRRSPAQPRPPRRLRPAPERAAGSSRSRGCASLTSRGSRLDVLVAEDNEVNQIVFSQILDELDVNYEIARNGQEAVDAFLAKSAARMILMDVSMPIMNGHEAARAIRRHEGEAGWPCAGRRRHGACPQRRPRALHRGGHGRLHVQADQPREARATRSATGSGRKPLEERA